MINAYLYEFIANLDEFKVNSRYIRVKSIKNYHLNEFRVTFDMIMFKLIKMYIQMIADELRIDFHNDNVQNQ